VTHRGDSGCPLEEIVRRLLTGNKWIK